EGPEDASDEFAIEAAADEDGCTGAAEVDGARQHALVPEAVNFCTGAFAKGESDGALFGDGLKTPGAAEDCDQRPDDARGQRQNYSLHEREPRASVSWCGGLRRNAGLVRGGHCVNSSGVSGVSGANGVGVVTP